MPATTIDTLTQQIDLHRVLEAGRDSMIEPQDLPGRFGRVIADVDRVLSAMDCAPVLAAGRARDLADVVELIRSNPSEVERLRQHVLSVHADYATTFDQLADQADDAADR